MKHIIGIKLLNNIQGIDYNYYQKYYL